MLLLDEELEVTLLDFLESDFFFGLTDRFLGFYFSFDFDSCFFGLLGCLLTFRFLDLEREDDDE